MMDRMGGGSAASPGYARRQEEINMRSESLSDTTKGFSLVSGGLLYQFLLRVGLVRPPLDRVGWRIIVVTLLAWAPLLVLAILGGRLARRCAGDIRPVTSNS
jgi:hypothetical protein